MEDSLQERGKSLEDAFFRQKDEELLRRLRAELDREDSAGALAGLTGIADRGVLERMAAAGVDQETLVAFSLVPLVAVAWADGVLQEAEQQAIIRAARQSGVSDGSAAASLLTAWLTARPEATLVETWKAYVHALRSTLDPASFAQLRNSVLQRAEDVASSAGGFLGFNAISESERRVLEELRSTFN